MGWKPKNANDSLMPFTTLQAIIGYAVFQYPTGQRRVLLSVIYTIIVTLIYWLLFAWDLENSSESTRFKSVDKVVYFIIYSNFVIAGLAQILHCYYNKKFLRIMDRITRVDETLNELGAGIDFTRRMRIAIMTIVFWLAMVVFDNVAGSLWFYDSLPLKKIIIVAILFHPLHINTIVFLNCSFMISEIETRFYKANELLEGTFNLDNKRSTKESFLRIFQNKVIKVSSTISNEQNSIDESYQKGLMQTIKHIHLELTLIAKDLNCIYGIIIVLEMAASFVIFTGLSYILYIMAVSPTLERRTLRITIIVMVIITSAPILISLNYMCKRATTEAKRTCRIIHRIHNRCENCEFLDEIRQFSLQLTMNPLAFSPFGFFTLGSDFIRGFFGSVVTYVVILIELGPFRDLHSSN